MKTLVFWFVISIAFSVARRKGDKHRKSLDVFKSYRSLITLLPSTMRHSYRWTLLIKGIFLFVWLPSAYSIYASKFMKLNYNYILFHPRHFDKYGL